VGTVARVRRRSVWLGLLLGAVLLVAGLLVALTAAIGCEAARAGTPRGTVCSVLGHPLAWLVVGLGPAIAVVATGLARPRRTTLLVAGLALAALLAVFVLLAAVGV
jgi:hypothetical protein